MDGRQMGRGLRGWVEKVKGIKNCSWNGGNTPEMTASRVQLIKPEEFSAEDGEGP